MGSYHHQNGEEGARKGHCLGGKRSGRRGEEGAGSFERTEVSHLFVGSMVGFFLRPR